MQVNSIPALVGIPIDVVIIKKYKYYWTLDELTENSLRLIHRF
jgi:hypothetical protein